MIMKQELKKLKNILFSLMTVLLIFYFIYHTFSGDRGIFVYLKLRSEYNHLQNELEKVRSNRLNAEHKTNLLKKESLDLDLLEEQAKSLLAYAKKNEEVILLDKE